MNLDHGALRQAVADGFATQTEWLAKLVSFDTTRGNEGPCQDWLAGEYAARGWDVDRYTIDEVAIEGLPGYSMVVDADYSKAVQVVAPHRVEKPADKSLHAQSASAQGALHCRSYQRGAGLAAGCHARLLAVASVGR